MSPKGSRISAFPGLGLQWCATTSVYHVWVLGIKPSFSCLHGKHFTELAICTGPGETVFFFFKHIQVAPEVPLLSGRYGSLYVSRTPSVWP